MTENKEFGNNVSLLIKKTGVTLRYFARILGVTEVAVGHWKRGTALPPEPRLQNIAEFFNERIPGLRLTPEKLLHEDLTVDLRLTGKRTLEAEPSYQPGATRCEEGVFTPGLFDLMSDRKTMELMKITKEEIEILKQARFAPGRFTPTREFYIDMLFHLRKAKEE
jgi:transcriptional regulator with XRE-family HTH domain